MASTKSNVMIWVKTEACTFGAIPVPPHTRLSVHNIKKMVSYAKSKGRAGYPKLSYSVWRHIALQKLQLPPPYAWMYFSAYHALVDEMTPQQKLELDEKLSQCANQQEIDSVRSTTSARLLSFVVFLHLQHLSKTSLRMSVLSSSEEWPMHSRSPDLEGGRSMASTNKGLDEHAHLNFILQNIGDIVDVIAERADGADPDDKSVEPRLSLDGAEALSLMLDGSTDKLKTIRPLHDILQTNFMQEDGHSGNKLQFDASRTKSGLKLVLSRSYPAFSIVTWIRNHVSQNPFGISTCISNGRRLSWPLAGEDRDSRLENKRGKIATNANVIPKDSARGNKIIIMSQVGKQTIVRSSHTLEGSSVKIHRCHQSYVYLLSPLRSVNVEKCRRSVFILGPVETTIHLNHCQGCTIIAPTRRFTISGCSSCTLHLMIPTPPLILNGNQSVVFAPYHTYYPQLEAHMTKVGLGPWPNYWDQPQYPAHDSADKPAVHQLLSPDQCLPFTIPFEMEGTTKAIPGGLPLAYVSSWEHRETLMSTWQEKVREADLSKEKKKLFKALVESQFQEWLRATGNNRQLDTLTLKHGNGKE